MRSEGLKIIAAKEFNDHLRSRKFHLIFGIILVVAIIGLIAGAVDYQQEIADYNDDQSTVSGDDPVMPGSWQKPSILSAFSEMATLMTSVGVILGIAMGFDLITREKESKSLKLLLSHPIYRDEVINGKALGGVAAIALSIGIVLVISFAVLLIFGIVPNLEETVRILLFGVLSFLLIFSFFAIALFISAVAKDSGSAIIYTLIIMIVLSSLLPIFAEGSVYTAIFGDSPDPPEDGIRMIGRADPGAAGADTAASSGRSTWNQEVSEEWQEYQEASQAYWQQRQAVGNVIGLLSPTENYETLVSAVTTANTYAVRMAPGSRTVATPAATADDAAEGGLSALSGLLGDLAKNIAALIITPALFFGLAWVRFMREDVR